MDETNQMIAWASEAVGSDFLFGPFIAFTDEWADTYRNGMFDFLGYGGTFSITKDITLRDTELGNYLAGYASVANHGFWDATGVRLGGHLYALE